MYSEPTTAAEVRQLHRTVRRNLWASYELEPMTATAAEMLAALDGMKEAEAKKFKNKPSMTDDEIKSYLIEAYRNGDLIESIQYDVQCGAARLYRILNQCYKEGSLVKERAELRRKKVASNGKGRADDGPKIQVQAKNPSHVDSAKTADNSCEAEKISVRT